VQTGVIRVTARGLTDSSDQQFVALSSLSCVRSICVIARASGTQTMEPVQPSTESAAMSPVTLSAAAVDAANGMIRLTFNGPLDAQSAMEAAHYSIVVNQQSIAIEGVQYAAQSNIVTLFVEQQALRAGDAVGVTWHGLHDAAGRRLPASGSTFMAR